MGYTKLRPKRGTLYEWTAVNPILDTGELVVECPDDGIGTGLSKFKIGDGVTKYTSLPYAFDGQSASMIIGGTSADSTSNTISIREDTYTNWVTKNPVLALGEISFDITNNSIKVGDGTTAWSALKYIKASTEVSGEYDFGSEDPVVSSAQILSAAADISGYPEKILPDGWNDDIGNITSAPAPESVEAEETIEETPIASTKKSSKKKNS